MSAAAQQFLVNLSSVLSLPNLRFNEDLVCCLYVPGELDLQMEWVPAEGRLMVLAPLGRIGSDPERVRALLSANFLFGGTRGETLSLEPDSDEAYLCSGIDLDEVSPAHAIELFSRFVDTAKQWRALIARGDSPLEQVRIAGSIRA
jgi:hypothetical protein